MIWTIESKQKDFMCNNNWMIKINIIIIKDKKINVIFTWHFFKLSYDMSIFILVYITFKMLLHMKFWNVKQKFYFHNSKTPPIHSYNYIIPYFLVEWYSKFNFFLNFRDLNLLFINRRFNFRCIFEFSQVNGTFSSIMIFIIN